MKHPVDCRHLTRNGCCANPFIADSLVHFQCPIAQCGPPAICRGLTPVQKRGIVPVPQRSRWLAIGGFMLRAGLTVVVVAVLTAVIHFAIAAVLAIGCAP